QLFAKHDRLLSPIIWNEWKLLPSRFYSNEHNRPCPLIHRSEPISINPHRFPNPPHNRTRSGLLRPDIRDWNKSECFLKLFFPYSCSVSVYHLMFHSIKIKKAERISLLIFYTKLPP